MLRQTWTVVDVASRRAVRRLPANRLSWRPNGNSRPARLVLRSRVLGTSSNWDGLAPLTLLVDFVIRYF